MSEDIENKADNTQPEPMPTVTKKDPKRVEQGKRLAMISKQAKERKMREKPPKNPVVKFESFE